MPSGPEILTHPTDKNKFLGFARIVHRPLAIVDEEIVHNYRKDIVDSMTILLFVIAKCSELPLVLPVLKKDLVEGSETRLNIIICVPDSISSLSQRKSLIGNMLYKSVSDTD